jgi:4-hydroxy-2-oxoheptanedioate aldolase
VSVPRIGTAMSLPDVALAELAADGLDLAWIDLEHGAIGLADVLPLAVALRAAGCEAHVRLPDAGFARLGPVLDAGVDGVVAPGVECADDVFALVSRLRYPPVGNRGYGPRRASRYGRQARPWEAAQVSCAVQIESPAGVDAADEIAAVDGVDTVVVGCADLSLALGAPQDLASTELRAAVERTAEAARAAGCRFGLAAAGRPDLVAALAPPGTALVIYGADVRLYAAGVDAAVAALRRALDGAGASLGAVAGRGADG